jgi:putative transposase
LARADNPMWGKRKIAVLMRREGFLASDSTVGRILAHLVARGAIVPVPVLRRRPEGRRIRFTAKQRYARRLPRGRKAQTPGELVQIDTLFVNVRPGKPIKHFTAYDPVAKWTLGRVATRASADSAAALLEKLIAEAPFPVRGVQVDGGSEFMAAFEQACRDNGLELCVLPPKRPDLNGCVERAQSTWRYEFYAVHDPASSPRQIAGVRRRLRPSLQPLQAARRPWRNDPRRLSQIPQRRRPKTVSYVLNPDTPLTSRPRGSTPHARLS